MRHFKEPKDYPDDRFSEEELARLKAEPMLIVEEIEDPDTGDGGDEGDGNITKTPPLEKMTVAELKALLDKLEVAYAANAKKDDLVSLVKENTAPPPEE